MFVAISGCNDWHTPLMNGGKTLKGLVDRRGGVDRGARRIRPTCASIFRKLLQFPDLAQ